MYAMDPRGGVNYWTDLAHNDPILFPKVKFGRRLAAFPCIPIVGQVQDQPAWSGVKLPRHGIMRSHEFTLKGDLRENHTRMTSVYTYEFRIPPCDQYPWAYQVMVSARFRHEADILQYHIEVKRSPYCDNKMLMPLSFGFSFYIATHGQSCAVRNGQEEVLSFDRLLRRDGERFSTNLTPLTVETDHGYLLISQQTIFDDVELWSREPESYLNVVVSAGRRGAMTLRPGEVRSGQVELSYQRK